MSVPVTWIRNNMLTCDQHGRQLTEAELKFQRSLQSLSIPEWYLNKRSSPPKILNSTPFDRRPPSWKDPDWKRTSVTNLSTLTISDAPARRSQEKPEPSNPSTGTYKIQRHQKSPNSKQQKAPSITTEKMDTSIPHITPRRDISKTFPKMSPSRKVSNINIVLSRKPSPLELPRQDDEDEIDASNYGTYVIIKRGKTAKKTKNDLSKSAEDSEITPQKTSSPNKREIKREQPEDNIQPPEPIYAQITPQKTSSANKRESEREEQPRAEYNIQPPKPIYAQITPQKTSSPNTRESEREEQPRARRVRTASTPKFSPGSLLSSTILEESPKGKRLPSENILRKLSIFEDSWKDASMRDNSNKASHSMEYRSSTLKSECDKPLSVSYEETCKGRQKLRNWLDKNIRSIEPILFEPVDSPNSSTLVREIVKKVENINISERTPVKRSHLKWKKSMVPAESKDLAESPKTPVRLEKDAKSPCARTHNSRRMSIVPEELKEFQEASRMLAQQRNEMERNNADSPATKFFNSRRTSWGSCEIKNVEESSKRKDTGQDPDQVNSPSTRFLTSRRKSMELENLVRSKQPPKEKSVVREIITAMTARAIKEALLREQNNVPGAQQNYVKAVVDALEKGNSSLLDETIQESFTSTIRNEVDLGSASESDAKSSSTAVYSNDTENSDSEGRSPVLVESDDSRKTIDFDMSLDQGKASEQKHCQEDDSVYWIPVARCKLPRTSSLLSMMSRLSTNGDSSPCVSPIRSDSENENAHSVPWGATFRKNPALSRNIFKIDETVVIDSGYSDKSDKSPAGCTTTDSNWSEDAQYESANEVGKNRITRASRRKSVIGTTFRVSKF
ncbi:uncharacterized protein LOC143218276 [Lasioglossum baleicum]|uniref:uncharacterized protein LOC143218276 n=1 Tax=Lasioglossum baleicum TaxID=434251 RepID=UPI003FCC88EC